MEREPCPYRIIDDAGGAFLFGVAGGTIWNGFGGLRNAPKGHRIAHAIARVKARTPILGGSFAVWGTVFSICDCSITKIRNKEDPWNAIISGAVTGGVLAARAGIKAAGRNALAGGVILAAIEGLGVVLSRVLMPMLEKQQQVSDMPIDLLDPPIDPLRPYVKSTPLWSPLKEEQQSYSYAPPPPSALSTQTIDLDNIPDFDPNAHDDWEHRQKQKQEEEARNAAANKPSWKFW